MNGIVRNVTLAIVIVLAIIIGGLFVSSSLNRTSARLETHILQMESRMRSNDWDAATESLVILKNDWDSVKGNWAMLIDHVEIDNIETTLSRLTEYISSHQSSMALAEASVLRQFVKHIPGKESFLLENIF